MQPTTIVILILVVFYFTKLITVLYEMIKYEEDNHVKIEPIATHNSMTKPQQLVVRASTYIAILFTILLVFLIFCFVR